MSISLIMRLIITLIVFQCGTQAHWSGRDTGECKDGVQEAAAEAASRTQPALTRRLGAELARTLDCELRYYLALRGPAEEEKKKKRAETGCVKKC
jgi:hypothetical protein